MAVSDNQPLLSVVIPSFNQLEGLRRTIGSLVSSKEDWLEIIISDGGSTDGSRELLLNSLDTIHKIRTSPDTGIYDGMNKGVEMASGKWVWFLGTGDTPTQDGLQKIKKHLTNGEASGLIGFSVHLLPPREPGVPEYYTPMWNSSLKWRNTLHHQGVFYPLEILKANKFDLRFIVLSDYHLHLKLWKSGVSCGCINEVIAKVDAGGVSRQFNKELYAEERSLKRDVLNPLDQILQAFSTRGKYLYKTLCRLRN